MQSTLGDLLNLATFTSGRRIHALLQVREAAVEMSGQELLLARIDSAIDEDRHTRQLDNHWKGSKGKPIYSPQVSRIDNWVDQLLTSIRDVAEAYRKAALEGSSERADAEHFLSVAFPVGVQAITSLPYVDQVAAVESLLQQVHEGATAEATALGLGPLLTRLQELTVQYREAVDQSPQMLEFSAVQAARQRGQRNLLEVVAIILGTFHSHTEPDAIAARTTLLGPILEQDQRIRALIRARRAVLDIDPDAPEPIGGQAPDEAPGEGSEAPEAPDADETLAEAG